MNSINASAQFKKVSWTWAPKRSSNFLLMPAPNRWCFRSTKLFSVRSSPIMDLSGAPAGVLSFFVTNENETSNPGTFREGKSSLARSMPSNAVSLQSNASHSFLRAKMSWNVRVGATGPTLDRVFATSGAPLSVDSTESFGISSVFVFGKLGGFALVFSLALFCSERSERIVTMGDKSSEVKLPSKARCSSVGSVYIAADSYIVLMTSAHCRMYVVCSRISSARNCSRGSSIFGIDGTTTPSAMLFGVSADFDSVASSPGCLGAFPMSALGFGAFAASPDALGVFSRSPNCFGVLAASSRYFGVLAASTASFGTFAIPNKPSTFTPVVFSSAPAGEL
mmetsp:Transcript_7362/g.19248  ORF Transcript_7362/g.19248 Transcript_7362/m.19248 type:complete len:337 (-) Transcript_7362:246-1256(-)